MKKFFFDILRDKGSQKFSITKVLALTMSVFFVSYLVYYLIILKEDVDHTLVIEMIGFISALVGMKNGWGINRKGDTTTSNINKDAIVEPKANDSINDEAVF